MRRLKLALTSYLLMLPQLANANEQTSTETTYQTLLALIDEMVANQMISREKADTLIANARTKASISTHRASTLAASPPSPRRTLSDEEIRHLSPDSNKVAPVRQGNIQIAEAMRGVPADLQADWSRGAPVFSSQDGRFSFKPRGRILADISSTTGSSYGPRNITVSGLRQFRFGAVGTVGEHLFFQFETDFRRNQTEVTNTFVGYRQRFGEIDTDIRAGHLLTDRGIDIATAATANPFINLNANSTALAPQGKIFLMGVAARAGAENWHVTAAVHGDPVDADYGRTDSRMFLLRGHWNPILRANGLIHLGGWVYDEHISSATGLASVNQVISGYLNTNIRAETKLMTGARGSRAFGIEAGGTYRSAYLFGEYGERRISPRVGANFETATISALSVNGGIWLTGEKPTYTARSGSYVAPNILDPILEDGGLGGVELVARYERVDFSDALDGGTGSAATVGVNWYLTNYFRLMGNYIRWRTDNRTGSYPGADGGNTVAARAEVAF